MERKNFFRSVKNLHLVSSKLVEGILSGDYRSVFRGFGIEFDEVREYVYGDDARLIDWNVSSRMASPYTKVFREERELILSLVVDVSASLTSGTSATKRELASLVAGLLCVAAVQNNDRVGALFFSDRIEKWVPPRKGRKHAARLVHDLLTLEAKGSGSNLPLAVRTALESMKRRGICVLLSDFKTPVVWRELTLLARRHDVIAAMLIDPLDLEFPPTGMVELADAESDKILVARGGSRAFRDAYRSYWSANRLQWEEGFARRGIHLLALDTGGDPAKELIAFFERRRRR